MKHKSTRGSRGIIDLVVWFLLFGLIFITYQDLPKTFFQQDEWASVGLAFSEGPFAVVKHVSLAELAAGKVRVLGTMLNNILLLRFPFIMTPYVMLALGIHWLNSVLVYIFSYQFTKRRLIAIIAAFYFSVASISSGAVTWFSAHTTAIPNAFFVLISLVCYMKYLQNADTRFRNASFFSAIIGFLFKESSIFLFLLLPFLSVLFEKRRKLKEVVVDHWLVLVYFVFVVVVRTVGLLGAEGQQGVFVTLQSNTLARLITHAFFYPLLSFSQMYIPPEIMGKTTSLFQTQGGLAQIAISDRFALYASIALVIFSFWVAYRNKLSSRAIYFFIIYCMLSFLPFAVLDRPFSSYLESRYYYLGVIGAAILLGVFFDFILSMFHKKRIQLFVIVLAIFLLTAGIYKNSIFVRREITRQVIVADERKQFLSTMKEILPDLPNSPIIYITGDSPGFYGLADLVVPFQQGMGYTLMVWYFDTGKVPKSFLSDMFLWNINEQGYRESEGRGFGYFWDMKRLTQEFQTNPHLSSDQVVAFLYIAGEKKLVEITSQIKEILIKDKK